MSEQLSEAVSNRIRALLAKTTENGATEAESMSAAAKARELMDRYRLSMSDIEIEAEPVVQDEVDRPNALKYAAVDYCGKGINALCGVRSWMLRRSWDKTVRVYLGLKPDVEMAKYLYTMIAGAIKTELTIYQRRRGYRDRAETSSFQVGMATRINQRLLQMARDLEPAAKTANGTALVVVKNAVVNQAYENLGLKFRGSFLGMSTRSSSAHAEGSAAGNRVNLSRPVASSNTRNIR